MEQSLPNMPEPTEPTRITFVGVRTDSVAKGFRLGDSHEFKVTGRIVHLGPEEMADGHVRQLVKVKVETVEPLTYDEPVAPESGDEGPEDID